MISRDYLKSLFRYDAETGEFTRLVQKGRGKPGSVTGTVTKYGYTQICIDYKKIYAHRLAWLYVHGDWPLQQLDHINGIGTDNRLANLRLATPSENGANSKRSAANSTGFKGVSWSHRRRKWIAQICVGGRRTYIGQFASPAEAHKSYEKIALKKFGEFARVE